VKRQRTTNNITKKSKFAYLRKLDCSAPKTEDSQRTFQIPQYVCDAILRAKERYEQCKAQQKNFQDAGYICFNEDGTGLTPVQLDNAFKKLLEKAGLPPMRLHDLRHTAATVMINSGMSLDDVRRQLGHTTDKMTRHYTQHAIAKPKIAEKMQKIFENAVKTAVQKQTPRSQKPCKSIANCA
jgi:integrase